MLGGLVAPAAFQVLYTEKYAPAADGRCISAFRATAAVAFLLAIVTVLVSGAVLGMLLNIRKPYWGYQHESRAWRAQYKAFWYVVYICSGACMLCFVAMYFIRCVCFVAGRPGVPAKGDVGNATLPHHWVNTGLIDNNGGTVQLPMLNNSGVMYNSGNLSLADTSTGPPLAASSQAADATAGETASALVVQAVLGMIGGVGVVIIVVVIVLGCVSAFAGENSKGRYLLHVHVVAYELWQVCHTAGAGDVVINTQVLLRSCQAAFQLHSDGGPLPRAFINLTWLEDLIQRYIVGLRPSLCALDRAAHTVTIRAANRDAFKRFATVWLDSGDWQP